MSAIGGKAYVVNKVSETRFVCTQIEGKLSGGPPVATRTRAWLTRSQCAFCSTAAGRTALPLALDDSFLRNAGSTEEMCYQANQEQNDEDEKTDSGNFSRSKSYHSKTEGTGHQRDYEKDQSVVQHGDSFLFTGLTRQ
jgi:hypothetical protein